MGKRRLAAFVLPLARGPWQLLRFDGEAWFLMARAAPHEEQAVTRVQIALELPNARWLRVQWGRRWWPQERHIWLRRRDHASLWPLIGAALALHQGRPWLGA
jgi:hypothetical protein